MTTTPKINSSWLWRHWIISTSASNTKSFHKFLFGDSQISRIKLSETTHAETSLTLVLKILESWIWDQYLLKHMMWKCGNVQLKEIKQLKVILIFHRRNPSHHIPIPLPPSAHPLWGTRAMGTRERMLTDQIYASSNLLIGRLRCLNTYQPENNSIFVFPL